MSKQSHNSFLDLFNMQTSQNMFSVSCLDSIKAVSGCKQKMIKLVLYEQNETEQNFWTKVNRLQ